MQKKRLNKRAETDSSSYTSYWVALIILAIVLMVILFTTTVGRLWKIAAP